MTPWQDYAQGNDGARHSVVGTLKVLEAVWSPQLKNHRDLLVLLPPSYGRKERGYPVIYMHDGQNLFDEATSFAGEWQVDETMEALSREGIEAIVVGIPNAGERRMNEYSPFFDRRFGDGQGEAYLSFVVETVKPLVDREWDTLPGRQHTATAGSSMGGLISLYAFFRCPEVFGLAGAISPALGFARGAIFPYVREAPFVPGWIYLDVGTAEWSAHWADRLLLRVHSRRYLRHTRKMRSLLERKGYRPNQNLLYVEEKGGLHHESAWARRFPRALRFLLNTPPADPRDSASPGPGRPR
jgi:predicted alpha/beta superfamily hydrolase